MQQQKFHYLWDLTERRLQTSVDGSGKQQGAGTKICFDILTMSNGVYLLELSQNLATEVKLDCDSQEGSGCKGGPHRYKYNV